MNTYMYIILCIYTYMFRYAHPFGVLFSRSKLLVQFLDVHSRSTGTMHCVCVRVFAYVCMCVCVCVCVSECVCV